VKSTLAVTGGAGFVGINFVIQALQAGYRVVVFDYEDRLERLKYSGLLESGDVEFHSINLSNDFKIPGETQTLVHFAALPHVDYSFYKSKKVISNNIVSLLNVLQNAVSCQIPVLFTSSVEVYGGNQGDVLIEDSRVNPLSPYAASKVGCEAIINSYRAAYDLTATTIRLTNLYGPWQAPDRIVPRLITQTLSGNQCEIDQGKIRDFVHVKDAADALMKVLEKGVWNETFNVSSSIGTSNVDVAEMICKVSGNEMRFLHTSDRREKDGRGMALVSCFQKLHDATGWFPTISLENGIQDTYQWYKCNSHWWQLFKSNIASNRNTPHFIVDFTRSL
jgi:dTDP-glucose 4,6-dehydratase